eukprot:TRINITY_DN5315_c0_g1_i1.p1 TRINITY_DN5315_c0_g1~~TRINITY_DN5315_c0_g1_i1.p1  ORF type:complete len:441 (-),score=74.77 TRINITY_DN5315_c0_g1_i1:116-1438(-)
MLNQLMKEWYNMYTGFLTFSLLALVGLTLFRPKETQIGTSPQFKRFQWTFLTVYLIMMAADWMQGPYVYALYSFYGFSRKDNGILFIAGFGSSMIFGTFAGTLADKYGRKLNCILYGITYSLSCATKHFNNFHVLMVGRLLGGFATSILWSAFESWMVSEHTKRGFESSWVSSTFSLMTVGNGIVAILAGFIAQGAKSAVDHPVAPFDVSLAFLVLGTLVISSTWSENYGNTTSDMGVSVKSAFNAIMHQRKVMLLGALQSLFEGGMYTFVFMWTPALEQSNPSIPHGLIFATFMICCSLGGSIFGVLISRYPVERFMRYVFLMAMMALALPIFTNDPVLIMLGFCTFEVSVGIFWPGIGTMRSRYVPEEGRATIMNIFRVPLNALVCLILVFQGNQTVGEVFTFCTAFMFLCVLVQTWLINVIDSDPKSEELLASAGEE